MHTQSFAPGLLVMSVFAENRGPEDDRPEAAKGAVSVALLRGMRRGAKMADVLETIDSALLNPSPDGSEDS